MPDDSRSDADLVRAFLSGDSSSFASLVARHERRVYNIALGMLARPEDAADTTQEVFLTCLRKLSAFRGESAFTTWLHRVTVNACYDSLRRRSREAPPVGQIPDSAVADESDRTDSAVDIGRALASIPEEFRAVVVLHDLQGQPYEVIASALGAPLGTVKSRLHRGRVMVGRLLRGEPGGGVPASNKETR